MKRANASEIVCQPLLPEIWIEILAHVDTRRRYSLVSVCKAWGKDRGLIDLSMRRLKYYHIQHFHYPTRLINLTKMASRPTELVNLAQPQRDKITSLFLYNTSYDDTGRNISLLTNLTCLKLAANVHTLHLTSLKGLQSLTRLCSNTELFTTGCLEMDRRILRSLTALVDLSFAVSHRFTDDHMSLLTNLRSLSIQRNPRPGITEASLSTLTRLEYLKLNSGNITSRLFLPLTRLKSLHLGEYVTGDVHHLIHLTALLSLSLSTGLPNRPSLLCFCTMLTSLSIRGRAEDDYSLKRALRLLTNLTHLSVNHTANDSITNSTLMALPLLTSLSIEEKTQFAYPFLLRGLKLRHLSLDIHSPYDRDILGIDLKQRSLFYPDSLTSLNLHCGSSHLHVFKSVLPLLTNLTTLTIRVYTEKENVTSIWPLLTTLTSLKKLKCDYPRKARKSLPVVEDITRL